MSILMELAHLAGALVTTVVIWIIWTALAKKNLEKRAKTEIEAIAVELGMSTTEANLDSNFDLLRPVALRRNSSDFLRNRLSDATSTFLSLLNGAYLLCLVGTVVGTIWTSWDDGRLWLAPMWIMPALSALYAAAHISIVWLCGLLTGRAPGQAKSFRRTFGLST